MTVQERLDAVIELLKKEKMAVKDVLEGGDKEAMRTVRAPRSLLALKAQTRKLNDSRGGTGEKRKRGVEDEEEDAVTGIEMEGNAINAGRSVPRRR